MQLDHDAVPFIKYDQTEFLWHIASRMAILVKMVNYDEDVDYSNR